MDALKIINSQNYFQFNNTIYQQVNGLPMGSPLSPLMADIFMNNFETNLLNSENRLIKNIAYYFRYVDDILVLFTGNDRQLQMLLNHLNSLSPTIKFTLEQETDGSINFLDLTILRIENRLQFKIYRKPTYSDNLIPANSHHPWPHKIAAFNSMTHRLLNIPQTNEDFEHEIRILKQLAINNGYKEKLVEDIIKKKNHKKLLKNFYPDITNEENKKYAKIPFIKEISPKIANYLKKQNLTPCFYTLTNLGHILKNDKDKIDQWKKSGVYQISCNDCNAQYIGQTGRNFHTRIYKEHLAAWNNQTKDRSHFADHLIDNNHTFNPQSNTKILHLENKGPKLDNLEALEIHRSIRLNANLCNNNINLNPSPLVKPF